MPTKNERQIAADMYKGLFKNLSWTHQVFFLKSPDHENKIMVNMEEMYKVILKAVVKARKKK